MTITLLRLCVLLNSHSNMILPVQNPLLPEPLHTLFMSLWDMEVVRVGVTLCILLNEFKAHCKVLNWYWLFHTSHRIHALFTTCPSYPQHTYIFSLTCAAILGYCDRFGTNRLANCRALEMLPTVFIPGSILTGDVCVYGEWYWSPWAGSAYRPSG